MGEPSSEIKGIVEQVMDKAKREELERFESNLVDAFDGMLDPTGQTPLKFPHTLSTTERTGMPALYSRFLVSVPHWAVQNPHHNAYYAQQEAKAEAARNGGNWYGYVFAHARGYRLTALLELLNDGDINWSDSWTGDLVLDVWTDCENIGQQLDDWRQVWDEMCGAACMNDEDHRGFAELPDEFTIYRGECNDGGWSWTLDRGTAEFFAKRGINDATGEIKERTIRKDQVMWFTDKRGESEVFVYTETDGRIPKACAHRQQGPYVACTACEGLI